MSSTSPPRSAPSLIALHSSPAARIARAVSAFVARLREAARRVARRRADLAALRSMSQHQLNDLGLGAGEIDRVMRGE